MNLTDNQNKKLESYKHSLSLDTKRQRVLLNQLEDVNKRIKSSERVIKYLLAIRSGDLQAQVEAKLGWEMLEPMEFIYDGGKVTGIYRGTWGAYGKSIKIDGVHYELKQIIEENIDNVR